MPELFVPGLRARLHPGELGYAASILSGGPRNLTLHLQNVTLREILNAASQATESFPADLSPSGWVYTFQPKPGLPAGGMHSWNTLLTAPRDWKVPAKQAWRGSPAGGQPFQLAEGPPLISLRVRPTSLELI